MNNSFDNVHDSILINCYGPFNHGTWEKNNKKVGNEEALKGRSKAIVENFCKTIREIYSEKEIKQLSFCDIGCYDVFLLVRLRKYYLSKKL